MIDYRELLKRYIAYVTELHSVHDIGDHMIGDNFSAEEVSELKDMVEKNWAEATR